MNPIGLIYGPMVMRFAPVGESKPLVDVAPPTAWQLLGRNASKDYAEDGVVINAEQELAKWTPGGGTAPRGVNRISEELNFMVNIHDMTTETFAVIMNNQAITETPAASGVAGIREFRLLRGSHVSEHALLLRGVSPYNASFSMQLWVPRAVIEKTTPLNSDKSNPSGIQVTLCAMEHDTEGFGTVTEQFAAAL